MAADRAITDDSGGIQMLAHPKIATFRGYAIGFAGTMGSDAAIRRLAPPTVPANGDVHQWVESELLRRLDDVGADFDGVDGIDLLIGVRGRLFTSTGSRSAIEYAEDCVAIGSGGRSAVAVLVALQERTKLVPRTLVGDAIRFASCGVYDVGGGPDVVVI